MEQKTEYYQHNESNIQKGFYKRLQLIQEELKKLRDSTAIESCKTKFSKSPNPLLRWSTNKSLPPIEDYAKHLVSEGTLEVEVLITTVALIEKFLNS